MTKLEEKIDSNQKLITDYIKANDAELKKVKNKVDKVENKLKSTDDTVKGIESRLTEVTDELNLLQKANMEQKQVLDMLFKKDKEQEVDKKRSNVIIEGLKEGDKENTRQVVVELLTDIGVTNVNENIVTAFRLGNVNKGRTRVRPRPILVKLTQQGFKHEIYKQVKSLKNLDEGKKVFLKTTYLSKYPSKDRNLDVLRP